MVSMGNFSRVPFGRQEKILDTQKKKIISKLLLRLPSHMQWWEHVTWRWHRFSGCCLSLFQELCRAFSRTFSPPTKYRLHV